MKSRIAFVLILVILMISVSSCATVTSKIPGTGDVKGTAKDKFMDGGIEIVDYKMDKGIPNEDGWAEIKVTGTAIYHPAKVGAKSFEDFMGNSHGIKFYFYSATGTKLPSVLHVECGENGKWENVKANVEFPFKGELSNDYIGKDNFLKISTVKPHVF